VAGWGVEDMGAKTPGWRRGSLSPDEEAAIRDLKSMLNEIANKKATRGAKLVLRPPA
jgi:hypothetical protein